MTDILRKLIPACVFVAAVVLVTITVLTFSPLFVAVPLAVLCAIAGRALLLPGSVSGDVSACVYPDDVTLVPRSGGRARS